MNKKEIWISDLAHSAQGNSAATFPLGASYVFSYAKQQLGNEFNFELFKLPTHLAEALYNRLPKVVAFSSYSWNLELGYKFASLIKERDPSVVTVFGGPCFPADQDGKLNFLKKKSNIDFFIEVEGETGFVDLNKKLIEYNFNAIKLKESGEKIQNNTYYCEDQLIQGPQTRVKDINSIPSPYLTGIMDKFFDLPLIPLIETTRGCPFTCTFCSDGVAIKNKVTRHDPQKVKEELEYIAKKVRNIDELCLADLNFSMYKQDIETAKQIAEIQKKYNFPTLLSASTGKNMPKRTMEAASIVKGWTVGGSIQSNDPDVLKAIKRSNISSAAYKELTDFGNKLGRKTNFEVILGLPQDSKQKHYESLRFGIDNNVKHMRMYQAVLLPGTEMASKSDREKYGFKIKFRTIPGCIGNYDIMGKKHSVAEFEEVIVGSNTLSETEYLDCRIMNLFIEAFYNNYIFEEVHAMLRTIGISPLDCLIYMKEHEELYSTKIKKIVKSFVRATTKDLFDTREQANLRTASPDLVDNYVGGELGTNELLLHRALLFKEFDEICDLLFESVRKVLSQKGLLNNRMNDYLSELKRFIIISKKEPLTNTDSTKSATFKYDFESIKEAEFCVDPNTIPRSESPLKFDFFHDKKQQGHISNQLKFYSHHSHGLGRLLQQCNLKMIFRRFNKSQAANT